MSNSRLGGASVKSALKADRTFFFLVTSQMRLGRGPRPQRKGLDRIRQPALHPRQLPKVPICPDLRRRHSGSAVVMSPRASVSSGAALGSG
ncbi:hypothetical protein AAFF_G00034400 [Aldrovandia affinis]|uniref:Uncharacterized protein n=1 Tax=Aldrovandia affinis TaxID=143900 RepID=A0AAD7S3P3_9TELE|nr:hypothetical protein AAFF_G00034400 [Aldrovandia affinis]